MRWKAVAAKSYCTSKTAPFAERIRCHASHIGQSRHPNRIGSDAGGDSASCARPGAIPARAFFRDGARARISDEVNERIRDLGIYRILQPRRFGGYEFDLQTFAEVMVELTRGDGSTGWVACFNTAHCWWAAQLPEEGQVEVFGADGDLRAPIMLGPTGVAKPVDGGYLLDGRWDYASGCDIGNWLPSDNSTRDLL